MYPPSPNDLPQLSKARTVISAFLNNWLTEDENDVPVQLDNIYFD